MLLRKHNFSSQTFFCAVIENSITKIVLFIAMALIFVMYRKPLIAVTFRCFQNINKGQCYNVQLGPKPLWRCINRSFEFIFIIPDFFCIFPMNFAMATLGLKEMGKLR